jgi:hypothetical protein
VIAFDIETGPLPWGELGLIVPKFDAMKEIPDPPPFDRSLVKTGNAKKPELIEEKINAAWKAHEEEVATITTRRSEAQIAYINRAKESAPLSPLTGRVLAIGLYDGKEANIVHGDLDDLDDDLCDRKVRGTVGERPLIEGFWKTWSSTRGEHIWVGHNIHAFDLWFLIVRSRILEIEVPFDVCRVSGKWPNWHPSFHDTMHHWSLGRMGGDKALGQSLGLDSICAATGGPRKPAGMDGSMFWQLYEAGMPKRKQAFDYLFGDLEMTWHVAEKTGLA